MWGVLYISAMQPCVLANFLQEFSIDKNSNYKAANFSITNLKLLMSTLGQIPTNSAVHLYFGGLHSEESRAASWAVFLSWESSGEMYFVQMLCNGEKSIKLTGKMFS